MLDNFLTAVNAVMPFILYMGLGYLIVRTKTADEAFLNKLNSMVFKAFFPVMLFNNFYTMDLSQGIGGTMALFAVGAILAVTGLAFLTISRTKLPDKRKGVVIQALFRGNAALFALPLAESVCGAAGRTAASVMVAVAVPMFNVLAVIILEKYSGGKTGVLTLLKKVVTNPLILGAAVGLIFLLLKIKLPVFITKPVSAVSSATTPLALMALGGTLHFASVKDNRRILGTTIGVRLLVIPALILAASLLFTMTDAERFSMFTAFASPVAVSSYTMAANMGSDGELAGQMVCVSTVVSLVTMFLWILFFKSMGLV
ncbi:MAG: AEC family transporter [Lachnospiraceae bacterium]|nr:AEC family transporter [Lachnospiraceae bacterium]